MEDKMTLEDLKKQLTEKEDLLKRAEATFHQLAGQIALLKDMIAKEEKK